MLFPFLLMTQYRSSHIMAFSSNAAPTSAGVVKPALPGCLLWDYCLRCSKFYAQEPGLACRRPSRGQKCTRCTRLKKPCIEVSFSDSLLILLTSLDRFLRVSFESSVRCSLLPDGFSAPTLPGSVLLPCGPCGSSRSTTAMQWRTSSATDLPPTLLMGCVC